MGDASVITFTFRNYGRTRATDVVTWGGLSAHDAADATIIKTTTIERKIPVVIPSQGTETIAAPALGTWLSEDTIKAINSGNSIMAFVLEIQYLDIFGKAHHARTDGTLNASDRTWVVAKKEAD